MCLMYVCYSYSVDGGVSVSCEVSEVSEGGVLTRQGTFSKDNEREGSEVDTVPQAK